MRGGTTNEQAVYGTKATRPHWLWAVAAARSGMQDVEGDQITLNAVGSQ